MGAGISGLLTTRGVVARRPEPLSALVLGLAVVGLPRPLATLLLRLAVAAIPRPLVALVLGLAIAGRPRPLAALVLGLAIARWPRVRVLIGTALVLGLAVAVGSASCPLFACSFAAGPPPRPATPFRTRQIWL